MEREEEIRRIAYRLWEEEGRPARRALDHWLRAEAAVRQPGQAPSDTKAPLARQATALKGARKETRSRRPAA